MTPPLIFNSCGRVTDTTWLAIRQGIIEDGDTQDEVATRLNISQSTVSREVRCKTPPSARRRIRKVSRHYSRRLLIKKIAKEMEVVVGTTGVSGRAEPLTWRQPCFSSARDIAREYHVRAGKKISASTVRRDLKAMDMVPYRVPRGPLQKVPDAAYRQKFCKAIPRLILKKEIIAFSDEKMADTNRHGSRTRWCQRGVHPAPCGNIGRFATKVHVWGIIAPGYRKLVFLPPGMLTADSYLKLCVRPVMKELGDKGRQAYWQHDGARPHTGAELRMRKLGVRLLPMKWPARSPDLNPIETVWGIIQRRVDDHKCTSAAQLRKAWKEEWDKFPEEQVVALCNGFRARMRQVVTQKGDIIKFAGEKRRKATLAAKKAKAKKQKKH